MKQYKILITCPLGNAGEIVKLQETEQVKYRAANGFLCETKVIAPAETKKRKGKR